MGSPAGSPYSVSVEQMITTMFSEGCQMRAGRWPTPSTDRSDHNGTASDHRPCRVHAAGTPFPSTGSFNPTEIGDVIPTLRRKQVS